MTADGWCIVRGKDGRWHEIPGPRDYNHGRVCRDCGQDPWPEHWSKGLDG